MVSSSSLRFIYTVVALLVLLAEGLSNNWLLYTAKPLLIPILFIWSAFTPDARLLKRKGLFLIALFFAFLGDTLLMLRGLFLPGLASFLLMQWGYSLVFWPEASRSKLKSKHIYVALVIVYMTIFIGFLLGKVNDALMRIALPIYGLSIGTMLIISLLRDVASASYLRVAIGALLFTISDSLIAYNRFVESVPMAGIWIMSTYMLAQYLIVAGVLKKGGDTRMVAPL